MKLLAAASILIGLVGCALAVVRPAMMVGLSRRLHEISGMEFDRLVRSPRRLLMMTRIAGILGFLALSYFGYIGYQIITRSVQP